MSYAQTQVDPESQDTITVVVLRDSPPFQFRDRESGEAAGYSVDIMDKIAEHAGLKVSYVFDDTESGMIQKVQNGTADAVACLGISKERQKQLLLTDVIHSTPISIFVSSQNRTIKELGAGMTVGTIKGSIANIYIKEVPDISIKTYNTYSEGLMNLFVGQIDAFIGGEDIFLKLAQNEGLSDAIKIMGKPFISIKRAIGLNREAHELKSRLNKAIAVFTVSDEYQNIYEHWYGKTEPFWTVRKTLIGMSLLIVAILSIMGLWRYGTVLKLNRSLLENIAERKKAEQELSLFQNLINQSNDAIFVIDPETSHFLSANNKACENLGYSRDELLTMGVIDIEAILPDNFSWEKHIEEVRGKGFMILEGLHRRKDGTLYPAEINASLVYVGEKEYMVSVARDITERKKREEETQRSHRLELVGKLAGGIAHDFKNVLTAILNNIYLCKTYTDRKSHVYARLEEAEKALMRANDLTFQLLSFSRGGAPVKKATSLMHVIRDTAEFALRGSNVNCTLDLAEDLFPVDADTGQMSQVIHNLVINASQAMPDGGTVWINAKNISVDTDTAAPLQKGKYVKITVKDQGAGIAHTDLKKIFEPYFTTRENGQGLGLSIVYSIIKNHGGHVTVESKVGSGTTFTIYLAASQRQIIQEDLVRNSSITGEGNILLMDDDEMIRNSLSEILRDLGYTPSCAENGEEALALYKRALESSNPFDAVMLDLTIPGGMGGKETMQELLKIDPDVKAIVSSGYSKDPVMAQYRNYGFRDVAPKPYKGPELSRILHNVINGVNEWS